MPIDKSDPRTLREQIADELRARITAGEFAPLNQLPSVRALAAQYDVGIPTVNAAIDGLRNQGLIYSRQGQGIFVRQAPAVRRVSSGRYQAEVDQIRNSTDPATSYTRDRGIEWKDYRLDKEFRETPASEAVAALLEVEVGTPLLDRRFVFHDKDRPTQMSRTMYPLALVAGTPVADPANEPWPGGNIAQLATLGIIVSRVHETTRTRMPTPDEVRTLRMAAGVPVFDITRVMYAGQRRDQPVEVAMPIVIPGDQIELDNDYQLRAPRSGV